MDSLAGKGANRPGGRWSTRWLLAFLAAAPLCDVVHGQAGPSGTSPPALPVQGPVPSEEPLYAAPTKLDRVGRIMAPVMINGQGPFRFIVDTGASRSALSLELARKLGLGSGDDTKVRVSGVTGSETVPSVIVQRLQAGDLVLRGSRLPVISPAVLANADGILGVEGLANMRIEVDFLHDRIRIVRSKRNYVMGGGSWYKVPVKLGFGRLMVARARIGRVPVRAVIDTGAEATLGNLALREALGVDLQSLTPNTVSEVIGATSETKSGNSFPAPLIRLGDTEIRDVNVTFADLSVFRLWGLQQEPALVLGMDILGTPRSIVFDYGLREILIQTGDASGNR
jgi:predicted aspartyl protease